MHGRSRITIETEIIDQRARGNMEEGEMEAAREPSHSVRAQFDVLVSCREAIQ